MKLMMYAKYIGHFSSSAWNSELSVALFFTSTPISNDNNVTAIQNTPSLNVSIRVVSFSCCFSMYAVVFIAKRIMVQVVLSAPAHLSYSLHFFGLINRKFFFKTLAIISYYL